MQSNLKSDYYKKDRYIYWQKNCRYWWWWKWCWNDSWSKCWYWYCWKRRKASIIGKWLFNRLILVCEKINFMARKTKLQEKCCFELVCYSQRTDYCNHSSHLQYCILFRGYSYLQWLSYSWILDDLYYVSCLFTCDWRRLFGVCCFKIPYSLYNLVKGKGSQY